MSTANDYGYTTELQQQATQLLGRICSRRVALTKSTRDYYTEDAERELGLWEGEYTELIQRMETQELFNHACFVLNTTDSRIEYKRCIRELGNRVFRAN